MRRTYLTLYAACLVHRGDAHLETLPLATVASVRVSFERDARRLGWGIVLVVLALLMFAVSAPLAGLAGRAASEVASGTSGVAAALGTLFRIVEAVAHVLPGVAGAAVLGGLALVALGWYGTTIFTLTFHCIVFYSINSVFQTVDDGSVYDRRTHNDAEGKRQKNSNERCEVKSKVNH